VFRIPETIDDLVASFENPHIPEEERLAREDDEDYVHWQSEEKAMECLSATLGDIPEWLQQRYKSKFKTKSKKESPEEKESRVKKQKEEAVERKRKASEEAMKDFKETLDAKPDSEAHIQDKRDWDMKVMQSVHRMLSSPRAKKKVGQYVAKRRKTESGTEKKALVTFGPYLKQNIIGWPIRSVLGYPYV